jgi:acetylornithine deacetylase
MKGSKTKTENLLAELVRCESVNPDLVPNSVGEGHIASYVQNWLLERGFEVQRLERTPKRPSIVGIARGTGGGKSLMLNGHLDTVGLLPFEGNPLEPRIHAGRMYGRGAFDMKGGLAAMMMAATRAREHGLKGDVLVACVADEENASLGTEEVLEKFRADAAIITEPTALELSVAHKGFVWFELTVYGVSAHGSRFDLGVDAIAKMGHFLVALEGYGETLRSRAVHFLLGHGSVHASLISGGQERSSYPAECRLSLERRTLPGETPEAVEAELREILEHLRARDAQFRYDLERGLSREPFEVAPSEEIVQTVKRQFERATGQSAQFRADAFWADSALHAQKNIPCLLFGSSGSGAHSAHEWVDLESVHSLEQILFEVIVEFCGGKI